jgi:hypothetical protein
MHLQSGITSMMDVKVGSDDVNWKAPLSLNGVVGKERKVLNCYLFLRSEFLILVMLYTFGVDFVRGLYRILYTI